MSIKQISTWLRNTGTMATIVATSTLAAGLLAPAAEAATFQTYDLVPPPEGEVDLGFGCFDENGNGSNDDCVNTHFLIDRITSLVDSTTGEQSLLFVDNLATRNRYHDGNIRFGLGDIGTNPGGYFFRPVAGEEFGQLEVGTFLFEFTETIDELTIDFFDVESFNSTGVLAINGEDLDNPIFVDRNQAGNGALNSMTFSDVDSIILKLGKDRPGDITGDGVDFRLQAKLYDPMDIPEPSTVLGLGLVAAMGALGLRKGKSSK